MAGAVCPAAFSKNYSLGLASFTKPLPGSVSQEILSMQSVSREPVSSEIRCGIAQTYYVRSRRCHLGWRITSSHPRYPYKQNHTSRHCKPWSKHTIQVSHDAVCGFALCANGFGSTHNVPGRRRASRLIASHPRHRKSSQVHPRTIPGHPGSSPVIPSHPRSSPVIPTTG